MCRYAECTAAGVQEPSNCVTFPDLGFKPQLGELWLLGSFLLSRFEAGFVCADSSYVRKGTDAVLNVTWIRRPFSYCYAITRASLDTFTACTTVAMTTWWPLLHIPSQLNSSCFSCEVISSFFYCCRLLQPQTVSWPFIANQQAQIFGFLGITREKGKTTTVPRCGRMVPALLTKGHQVCA